MNYEIPFDKPFISVDPGSTGTGVAIFTKTGLSNPIVIKNTIKNFENNCDLICNDFKNYLNEHCIILHIFFEKPQFFDSHKGLTTARSDKLLKLIKIYSRLWQIGIDLNFNCYDVEINKWKGQLDKEKVIKRLQERGYDYNSHDADAVAMGLYLRGEF